MWQVPIREYPERGGPEQKRYPIWCRQGFRKDEFHYVGMKRPTLPVQAVKVLRLMPLKQKEAYGHHSPNYEVSELSVKY